MIADPTVSMLALASAEAAQAAGALGLITTALVLGIRHGFDWDHLAAIADVTSTSTTADVAETDHEAVHRQVTSRRPPGAAPGGAVEHRHAHGGATEILAHHGVHADSDHPPNPPPPRVMREQAHALVLGSLYALGHATAVAVLGLLALSFGALLPDWVDQVMGPIVGATLVILGLWVFASLYQYSRHGYAFRLRSRWMLVFDSVRYLWRRFQAWLHGHEHVDPMEMSSYGPKTAFGVGVIHGIGAETGSQVLLIAAIGGAAAQGLGIPMMLAFIVGLLVSNSIVVVITATGFIASRLRERLYVAIGVVAGAFSLVIGTFFLLGVDAQLPSIDAWLQSLGIG